MDGDQNKLAKPITLSSNLNKILLGAVILSLVLGVTTGYVLANKSPAKISSPAAQIPKNASQDTKTFRDFAEGIIKPKPQPANSDEYTEGTHLLIRSDADPVALTSSVVDLSQYEGKKVKIYGETQKALKEGWLMDVGKVEVSQ